MSRLKNEKKILVAELRSLRDKGLYSSSGGSVLAGREEQCPLHEEPEVPGLENTSLGDGAAAQNDYCAEKLSELAVRMQLVDRTLKLDSGALGTCVRHFYNHVCHSF